MSQLSDQFRTLESQVKQLIKIKQSLENEVEVLKSDQLKLSTELSDREKTISELKEKNSILRIAGGSKGEDNREMKLKINEIVREVDKCIAQLNQ